MRLKKMLFVLLAFSLANFVNRLALAKPTHIIYWEKWTGFEKDGMGAIVDEFNRSQSRIYVDFISVSGIDQKTLVATAGGVPPDVAGLWDDNLAPFADKNALIPLDDYLKKAGIGPEHYAPIYWEKCVYAGHVWCLPSTPAILCLHWNKELFRKAGLDPEVPPKTIAELDAFSKRLTKIGPDGQIEQMGFLPPEPGWWNYGWGFYYGGKLWDGGKNLTPDSPENIAAYTWIQSYAKQYGPGALQLFRSGFGSFASAQNPFMAGRVAMVLQGVWMGNYIHTFNPKMEWGAAAFPVLHAGDEPVAQAQADILAIPRGAKHPDEAFEFIKYVNQQGPMERLCLSHRKNSPLSQVSEEFYRKHQNPYIRMYQKLVWSKRAVHIPLMSIWNQYAAEMNVAFDKIWLLQATPQEALAEVRQRLQPQWERELKRQSQKPSPWLGWAPIILSAVIALGMVLFIASREAALRRQTGKTKNMRQKLAKGLSFSSLGLIGLAVFTLIPVSASFIYSFCDYSVLSTPRWIGLDNFTALATDSVFWLSLKNTLIYALFSLPLGLLAAFLSALLLDSNVRGVNTYRTLFYLPTVTPLVASSMVWLWIFNSQYGVLNYFLGLISFGWIKPLPWLTDSHFAMPSLIFMSLWGVGQTTVIMLAALQDVPVSLYEAAEIDGASWWHKIWNIAMPFISPVLYFNIIMGIIGSLQVFAVPYIMTGGGPARATEFYAMYLWENAFTYLRMGYACAMAWVLFMLILLLTAVFVRASKNKVHYTA